MGERHSAALTRTCSLWKRCVRCALKAATDPEACWWNRSRSVWSSSFWVMAKQYDVLFRLLLLGDSGVGKTCMLRRFTEGEFDPSHISTIGKKRKAIRQVLFDKFNECSTGLTGLTPLPTWYRTTVDVCFELLLPFTVSYSPIPPPLVGVRRQTAAGSAGNKCIF